MCTDAPESTIHVWQCVGVLSFSAMCSSTWSRLISSSLVFMLAKNNSIVRAVNISDRFNILRASFTTFAFSSCFGGPWPSALPPFWKHLSIMWPNLWQFVHFWDLDSEGLDLAFLVSLPSLDLVFATATAHVQKAPSPFSCLHCCSARMRAITFLKSSLSLEVTPIEVWSKL